MKFNFRIVVVMAALCIGLGSVLTAQDKLTTVAVFDIDRVYASYYAESEAVRAYDSLKAASQAEITRLATELIKMQNQLLNARNLLKQNKTTQGEVLKLEQEVMNATLFLKDYKATKDQELSVKKAEMASSSAFMQEVQRAVEYISISQGFTIVVLAKETFWHSSAVDITAKVIEYLKRAIK